MNVLIIEDQPDKAADLANFLEDYYSGDIAIDFAESLRSGLAKIIAGDSIDLILLDMSMPIFDSSSESGSEIRPESFAGKQLMLQMQIRDIVIPVIVITQYAVFEKGNVTLEELDQKFRDEETGFYLGCVYYQSASNEWKEDLAKEMMKLDGKL